MGGRACWSHLKGIRHCSQPHEILHRQSLLSCGALLHRRQIGTWGVTVETGDFHDEKHGGGGAAAATGGKNMWQVLAQMLMAAATCRRYCMGRSLVQFYARTPASLILCAAWCCGSVQVWAQWHRSIQAVRQTQPMRGWMFMDVQRPAPSWRPSAVHTSAGSTPGGRSPRTVQTC